jgi:hypothetical protein
LLIANSQKILRHFFKFIKYSFQKSLWVKNEEFHADFKAVEKVAKHFKTHVVVET